MIKYLVAAIWPVGIVALAGVAFMLIRDTNQASDAPRGPAVSPREGRTKGRRPEPTPRTAPGRQLGNRSHKAARIGSGLADAAWESAVFGAVAAAGTLVVFGFMCALGLIVVRHGLSIDRPIFDWMSKHQAHIMRALMKRLTKVGDTWTTWGAALAAAACLAVTWRNKKWLPPIVLVSAIVIDHFTTLALRHVFHRIGPPTSPLGTYPSGGCDRVVLFYGLIAYLLWREFSGQRRTAILVGAAVAALGFNEAYSRVYLSLHWFTDALSGLLYGGLLLTIFIIAVHFVAGRPSQPEVRVPSQRAAAAARAPLAAGPPR